MVGPAAKDKKALVVEDDVGIRELVYSLLQLEGHPVRAAADGLEGLKLFIDWRPDLVVADLNMPLMDGWTLLERIREVSSTPVIILTASGEERHVVRGLGEGADDYIVKPFRGNEFLARVDAVLRRLPERVEDPHLYRDQLLSVDFAQQRILIVGKELELSPTEYRLLVALVKNAGVVMSTERLLDLTWGFAEGGPENVRVYIGYIRKKLQDAGSPAGLIETVRGFGYRYSPPSSPEGRPVVK